MFNQVKVLSNKIIIISSCVIMGFLKSVHGGQKIQCPHCEHKATKKGNLQTHIKSVHEGQKFPCPQCEYKATLKGHLQTHIKSVHEGHKFQCTQCEYLSLIHI